MAKLTEIEGIGEINTPKLADAGIATTQGLLEEGSIPQGRKEIAEKTGISGNVILCWVNHVDRSAAGSGAPLGLPNRPVRDRRGNAGTDRGVC